jgi:two-component system chemotaxis sensor kinase CheA
MDEIDDVVKEFLVESREGLDQLDRDLVALEHHPGDTRLLARIFRCIHTIKGTCGFLGFGKLEAVTHVGESLLALLRSGSLPLTPARTSGLLRLVDATRQMLASIEATGIEGAVDYSELVMALTALQDAEPAATSAQPLNMGDLLLARGLVSEAQVQDAADRQQRGDPRRIGEILVEQAHVPPSAIVDALETQVAEQRSESIGAGDTTVRIDVRLLGRLTTLVGELGVVRSQLLPHASLGTESALAAVYHRLTLITSELQEEVMKTRMQPIGDVWSRFPRVVRDLALACRKKVRIEMHGEETELDRAIIAAIKDPLTHIVRNSIDHGFELPVARIAAGKPAEGRLTMHACHEGGQVTIEIADDGAGIDPERLRATAVRKGLITAKQAARMTDRDALNLTFAAGFSTAERVTNVSGRGVGMDVVRTNVANIGGTVEIESARGKGTVVKIRIPLGPPMTSGPMVAPGGDRFAGRLSHHAGV